MAHFFRLQDELDDCDQVCFQMKQDASDAAAREKKAIIKVQSMYRGSKVRERWHAVLHNALLVQRLSRGCLARWQTRALRLERTKRLNEAFFHHCSSVIQKFFRGWWSRRHLHDYYGRKAYIEKVQARGEYTKEYLRRYEAIQIAESKAQEERQMRQEFDNLAGELHHLVSTKTIQGVYNPPYNDMLPRAFEKPIEQHLRESCRVQLPKSLRRPVYRSRSAASLPPLDRAGNPTSGPPQELPERQQKIASRTASVGRLQRIQGPFRSREQVEVANIKAHNQYRSLQSDTPYHAVQDAERLENRLNKITRMAPVDFVPAGLTATGYPPTSVHANVPYRNSPVELRSDYTELPKIRDKPPFFTSLARDRHFHEYQDQEFLPCGHV